MFPMKNLERSIYLFLSISDRPASLAPGKSNDCPSNDETALKYMGA